MILKMESSLCVGIIKEVDILESNGAFGTIKLTRESYAPGIWAGIKKMTLFIYSKTGQYKHTVLHLSHNLDNGDIEYYGNPPEEGDQIFCYYIGYSIPKGVRNEKTY